MSLLESAQQIRRAGRLVVLVVGDERRRQPEMTEQPARVAGVLGGDEVHRLQHGQRPQGDVLRLPMGVATT